MKKECSKENNDAGERKRGGGEREIKTYVKVKREGGRETRVKLKTKGEKVGKRRDRD
jgi:hypothetical protein